MTTAQKYVIGLAALVALVVAGLIVTRSSSGPVAGAVSRNVNHVESLVWWFAKNVFFGTTQQLAIGLTGNLTNTSASAVNTLLGTLITNELIQSAAGFSLTMSTANGNSQTLTAAQFCSAASVYIPMTSTTTLTIVLPSATSTLAACGASLGSFATQIIDNESSSVVTIATTTGEVPKQGIQMFFASSTGVTANIGGAYPMTATGLAVLASSTLVQVGQYTGTSTSNPSLNIINTFYKRQ